MSSTAARFNRDYGAPVSSFRNSFLFIVFFNLLVFFPSLGHYFFSDDWWSIAAGKYGLSQIAPTDMNQLLFRPLFRGILYGGEYFLFKDNAFLWHAAGLLFHFLALFLLLKLLCKIASPKIAFFLTLNFSCLTLNTHAVAWAAANGYILFFAAVTGLVYALIAYAETPNSKYLIWAFCCATAACFLYENGVIAAVLSVFYLRRALKNNGKGFSWKREGLIIAPVFLYGVSYLVFNFNGLVLVGGQLWASPEAHHLSFFIGFIAAATLLSWWTLGLFLPSTIIWLLPAKLWRLVFTLSLRHISAGMVLNFFVVLILLSAFLLAVSRARARQYRFLIIFLGLLAFFYAFIIACCRIPANGFVYTFSQNAYYSYIFSGYLTIAAACLIDPARCSAGTKKALMPLVVIFVLLNAFYSFKVNCYMYEESRLFLQYKKYMAAFIAKHRNEPDFSLRVDNDIVIFYTTPPLPLAEVVCDKRYLAKLKPKYLLDLKELDFYKEWQRSATKPSKAWYRY